MQKRRKSYRLLCWDYRNTGYYFVTICTENKKHFFGEITNQKMHLSQIGKIVSDEWGKTEQIRNNVCIDTWVVMPNHIHGIIIINDKSINVRATRRVAPTNPCGPTPKSLGSIIGQFKSKCTKRIWTAGYHEFRWHRNFHDHIIRSEKSLNQIRRYIMDNPAQWDSDENNPINIRKEHKDDQENSKHKDHSVRNYPEQNILHPRQESHARS